MGTEKQVELSSNGVQNNNVVKKKIVYNMYRDMLKTYNGRANEILETKPSNCVVTEDRGISDRVESMARQIPMSGPPPPPPLSLGAVPAVRLKSEISEHRPEPPACVQNAMMTKDKKPFTYTPGGLDLSQIKSPRMAKRVSRNAAAEGVGTVPQSPQPVPQPVQQQMMPPMPQGPGGMPPPPPPPPGVGAPMAPPPPPSGKLPAPSNNLPPYTRPDIKIPENPMNLLRKTGGPHRPPGPIIGPDEVLTRQPVMGDQNQPIQPPLQPPPQAVQSPGQPVPQPIYRPVKPPQPIYQPMSPQPQAYQQQPPPQVYQPPPPQPQVYQPPPTPAQVQTQADHRPETRTQVGTLYIPPLSPEELQQKNPPLRSGSDSPGSPLDTLKKAPTPWLTNRVQQRQQEVPSWARSPAESTASSTPTTPGTPATPAVSTPATPAPSGGTRVIPVKIELKDDAMQQIQQQQQQFLQQQQQQFQQQQQQFLQQQQQQFRQHQQDQFRQQQQYHQQQTQQQQHIVRVIPIQIEGRSNSGPMSPTNNVSSPELLECGPVQSPTFRILQRVTSRDEEIHAQPAVAHPAAAAQPFSPPTTPVDQMRRLQFSEEDKSLMNRVRNQVPKPVLVTRGPPGIKMNQPGTPTGENVPASEQRAPEPRKYTGSAIPSRSFQMLQAMVAPENCGPGQSDL